MEEVRTRLIDLALRADEGDEIPVTISSEHPVQRDGYDEVLVHAPGSVDLVRAPLPLIELHDTRSIPVGVVDRLQIIGRKLRGVVKFGNSARARELLADVKKGVIRSLSIGYEILANKIEGGTMRVTRFRPYEVSIVGVPADPNAGFFRSRNMTFDDRERERALAIVQACEQARDFSAAERAIAEGTSLSAVRQQLMAKHNLKPVRLGMSRAECRRYNLAGLLLALSRPPPHSGFEFEIHEELEALHGAASSLGTAYIPPDIFYERAQRDLTVANAPGGGFLVETGNDAGFVELVRPRSVAMTLGAQTLEGLRGSVTLPRIASGATVNWLSTEATSATESQPSLGQIALSPKSAACYTEFSRQLLLQSSPGVNALLQNDLLRAVGTAVDVAVLNGSGASGQPTGIINTAGIGTVSGTALALAGVLEFQTDIGDNLGPSCGYATTRATAALLAARQKATGTSSFLWEGSMYEGVLGGLRAMTSGNIPASGLLFGAWDNVLIASWGVLQLEVNPYQQFTSAILGARAVVTIDVAVRNPPAFSYASTVT